MASPAKRFTSMSDHIQHDQNHGDHGPFHPLYVDNYNTGSILRPNYLVTLLPFGEFYHSPRYRGDIYDGRPTPIAKQWEIETASLPYLNKIRAALKAFPSLRHLASWMEVSTSETRYKYLSQEPAERAERLHRVRVCQVDLEKGCVPMRTHYKDSRSLAEALAGADSLSEQPDARIYIIEDLSTDILELFGEKYHIDPYFWTGHIDDYLWSSATSETAEIRSLDLVTRKRPYLTLPYLRPRYYRSTASFENATRQAANFNVLRQLDSDRGRESIQDDDGAAAALMRAKASLWVRPNEFKEQGVLAIILIDPTPSDGYRLLGGYDSFENWPTDADRAKLPEPPRTSLFDDVIYWMSRLNDADTDSILRDPKACAIPALELILSDWHHVIQYITAQLGRIEWEIEIPAMRKQKSGIEATMQKLHPWRRNISLYRAMVAQSIDRLFSKETQLKYDQNVTDLDRGLPSLLPDFKYILDEIDRIQQRVERIVSVASALLSIEDGRRAAYQNNNVARLTYLATIFIPLSFVSSFLSMSPNISQMKQTFWIYFAISIPLTALALLVADFWHIQRKIGEVVVRLRRKN